MCTALKQHFKKMSFERTTSIDFFVNLSDQQFDLNCFSKILSSNGYTTSQKRNSTSRSRLKERRKRNFVVIILDSVNSLKSAFNGIQGWQFSAHGFFLIILTSQPSNMELDSMLNLMWKHSVYNVDILLEFNKTIFAFTFFPFSRDKCHDTSAKLINQFTNSTWTSDTFFPAKLKNFQGCTMKAACYNYGPTAQTTVHPNGSTSLSGSDVDILRGIAELLNISLQIEVLTEPGSWGQVAMESCFSASCFFNLFTGLGERNRSWSF